jgi:hypothetical protein
MDVNGFTTKKMEWFAISLTTRFLSCNDHLQLIAIQHISTSGNVVEQVAWVAIHAIHCRWNCIFMQLIQLNYNYVWITIVYIKWIYLATTLVMLWWCHFHWSIKIWHVTHWGFLHESYIFLK